MTAAAAAADCMATLMRAPLTSDLTTPVCKLSERGANWDRLHLIDLDNLHGGTSPDKRRICRVHTDYHQVGVTNRDLVFAACNHDPTGTDRHRAEMNFQVRQHWAPATLRLANGPDGADKALIADAAGLFDASDIGGRFEDVVIGSGDHIFAPMARRFRDQGLTVHVVVASQKSLAHELRAAANGCIWLLPTGRCLRHAGYPTTN